MTEVTFTQLPTVYFQLPFFTKGSGFELLVLFS